MPSSGAAGVSSLLAAAPTVSVSGNLRTGFRLVVFPEQVFFPWNECRRDIYGQTKSLAVLVWPTRPELSELPLFLTVLGFVFADVIQPMCRFFHTQHCYLISAGSLPYRCAYLPLAEAGHDTI